MTRQRSISNFVAMLCLPLAGLWPNSTLAAGLRAAAEGYILLNLLVRARSGYLRRRPYWTADSWRRYLTACIVPVGALAMVVVMLMSLQWRLPVVGASRSITRSLWAAASMVFIVVGAAGAVTVIEWLHGGDPAQQFALPDWLTGARRNTA